MKIYHFLILLIASLFIAAGCTANQNNDAEFKAMCQNAGYEWMLMKPTKDGKIIKEAESCWGCMVENVEHVCNKENFNEIIKITK